LREHPIYCLDAFADVVAPPIWKCLASPRESIVRPVSRPYHDPHQATFLSLLRIHAHYYRKIVLSTIDAHLFSTCIDLIM